MAIPGYQDLMLPLLQIAADGKEHTIQEAMVTLAEQLNLSEEDQETTLASGQTRFYNRIMWAETYLYQSALIEKTGRARFKISARGINVLKTKPTRIDNKFLEKFPEYLAFKNRKKDKLSSTTKGGDEDVDDTVTTPDEQLDIAYTELREALAAELLQGVRAGTPKFFEHLVVDVLVAMGYGGSQLDAAQVVGKSGDGGIDGVIKEDRLGLDMVYVQAKSTRMTLVQVQFVSSWDH